MAANYSAGWGGGVLAPIFEKFLDAFEKDIPANKYP
jgi:hypothetical protein